MPFMDLLKKAIFEDEPQPQNPIKGTPDSRPARPSAPAPGGFVPMTADDNQFYARLLKQTDLSAAPELAKIEAFAAPLVAVIPDKSLRYKAALATAQAQGGLTKAAILKGFDALLNALDSSADSFAKQSDEVARTEVEARTSQVADTNTLIVQKQKEIAELQQQVRSMQSQVEASRAKLQQAKANFAAALQRRKTEIQQQRREFETILE